MKSINSRPMTARIEALDWMSPETRQQALYKMSRFGVKIGYPDQWRSYDGLQLVEGDLHQAHHPVEQDPEAASECP